MSEDKRKKANDKKITLPKASEIYYQRKVLYERAAASAGPIVKRLLPDGRVKGQYWAARDPQRPKDHAEKLSINLMDGKWQDYRTGRRGGNVISLVAYLSGFDETEAEAKSEAAVRRMLGDTLDEASDED